MCGYSCLYKHCLYQNIIYVDKLCLDIQPCLGVPLQDVSEDGPVWQAMKETLSRGVISNELDGVSCSIYKHAFTLYVHAECRGAGDLTRSGGDSSRGED